MQDWNARQGLPGLKLAPAPHSVLLSDAQVQAFIRNGYLALQPSSLSAQFHKEMYDNCQRFFAGSVQRGDEVCSVRR